MTTIDNDAKKVHKTYYIIILKKSITEIQKEDLKKLTCIDWLFIYTMFSMVVNLELWENNYDKLRFLTKPNTTKRKYLSISTTDQEIGFTYNIITSLPPLATNYCQ